MKPPLIALVGNAGTGKSTIASLLTTHHNYHRVRFADPLKRMLKSLGLSQAELDGELKETPNELLLGKTPRFAMQTLGTEWGRNLMGSDFWTTIWRGIVRDALNRGAFIVCDDCRFMNEALVVRGLGGQIWRVVRPGIEITLGHPSETELHRIAFDKRFNNDGKISDLRRTIEKVMQ